PSLPEGGTANPNSSLVRASPFMGEYAACGMPSKSGACALPWPTPPSRQLANADVAEVDRRALRLQAQVARPRLDAVAPRHLLAVDPQPDLAVDRPHVVVVPL